jgi:hypothetical protein
MRCDPRTTLSQRMGFALLKLSHGGMSAWGHELPTSERPTCRPDGKIVEHWGVANDFEALFTLGALRPADNAK